MIAILLYEGVSAFEATGALAAFAAAGRAAELVASEALVQAREGVRLVPTRLGHAPLEPAEAVLVPGGDVRRPLADAELVRILRARRGRWSLFSGDASRLAHAAGFTQGRRVSRLPGDTPIPDATAVGARVVVDGRFVTASGGDAALDMALHLIDVLDGGERAKMAAASLGREHRPFAFGETHAGR